MKALPLAVDLDGTLIKTDLFGLCMLAFLRREPWRVFEFATWFVRGRAPVKRRLAGYAPPVESLPYNVRFLAWLCAEKSAGRTIVLASASDAALVEAVAAYLGVFDAVFASDGQVNLKSRRKAAALAAAFPEGFVYAGNERADLRVWAAAKAAVLVNASDALTREARRRFEVEREFPTEDQQALSNAPKNLSEGKVVTDQEIEREIVQLLRHGRGGAQRKVAAVVAAVTETLSRSDDELLQVRVAGSIKRLIAAGHLQAYGDVSNWQYSEVRLLS